MLVLSYGSLLIGLGGIGREETEVAGAALGTGLVLMPLTFGVATFMTVRERPFVGLLGAMGAWVLALPVTTFDVMIGLLTAFAAGAVVAIRRNSGARWSFRAAAMVILVGAATGVATQAPEMVVLTAPLLICPLIALADDLSLAMGGTPLGTGAPDGGA
jgi:hypothetical protein